MRLANFTGNSSRQSGTVHEVHTVPPSNPSWVRLQTKTHSFRKSQVPLLSPTTNKTLCLPRCHSHFSSHIAFYCSTGEARERSSVWNGSAITPFSLKVYYPPFLAFLHGHHEADGGKWQWSGLLSQSIRPQAGEIASTPQALQITTLSQLNATAISKETGSIFHHRRGAHFRARETGASCLALFLERRMWSVVKEQLHSGGTQLSLRPQLRDINTTRDIWGAF